MTDGGSVGAAAQTVEVAAAELAKITSRVRAARDGEGLDALARIVTAATGAGLASVEDQCAAWSAIAAERARLALVRVSDRLEAGDGERRVAVVLTAEGVEGLAAVVASHPLPWCVDGRELVDAAGEVVFAAATGAVTAGADRRGARDLLLGLLAALVVEAGTAR